MYLDIVGLLPTPEEYTRFMSNPEPNKRELLVDELARPQGVRRAVGDEVGRAACRSARPMR